MPSPPAFSRRASFTLIELLVVMAIVAILSVVVIVVLNPIQLLRQARDSNRLSDMNTLTKAVALFETDQAGATIGTASTTYFSVSDPSATSSLGSHCQGTGLPGAPPGWTYRCPASSTQRLTNGTGWLPVNFDQMSFRALTVLPTDPVNTTSSGFYYSYTPGGSFALTTTLESDRYLRDKAVNDAGYDPGRYETGSDLSLVPRSQGLVGWWKMDEGAGTTVGDYSGRTNTGTLTLGTSTALWQASSSCKVGQCLQFDGGDDRVNTGNQSILRPTTSLTVGTWAKVNTGSSENRYMVTAGTTGFVGYLLYAYDPGTVVLRVGNGSTASEGTATSIANGVWFHVMATYDNTNVRMYINGSLVDTKTLTGPIDYGSITDVIIGNTQTPDAARNFNGLVDDVRIYSRVLTAAEISAIYNATK